LKASIFFWFASGVMSFSRVAVAIHWPTDIIVGVLVGVLSAVIILLSSVWNRLVRYVCAPLIQFQQKIRTVF
jgi:membrane-associated phospholipid phosphatase